METEYKPQGSRALIELLFSTTTGIFYGLGVAAIILLLLAFTLEPQVLSSLSSIFLGKPL